MATLRQQFTTLMQERMAKLGLSQRDLAKRMNVSQPTIAKLLSGSQSVGLDVVENVACALDCEPSLKWSCKR